MNTAIVAPVKKVFLNEPQPIPRLASLKQFLQQILIAFPNGVTVREAMAKLKHWKWVREATLRQAFDELIDEGLVERHTDCERNNAHIFFWHDGMPAITQCDAPDNLVAVPSPWWGVPIHILTQGASHV